MHRLTADIDGQEISYLQSEGDGRPVVFVHGNSASARTWRPLLDGPFGRRFRCLALDLPGHGESAPAADHALYSLPGYAAVLAGFAGALLEPRRPHRARGSAVDAGRGRIRDLRHAASRVGRPDGRGIPA